MSLASDLVFAFGRIIASAVGDVAKDILVNVRLSEPQEDVPDTEAECAENQPMFGALGVVSRPDPPDAGGHTEVITAKLGGDAQPVASRDLRLNKRTNPKEGAIALVQYGGGMVELAWNKDRSGTKVSILAPKLTSDGSAIDKSHAIWLDSQNAKPSVGVFHRDGHSLQLTHQKKALLVSANGQNFVGVDDSGVLLSGTMTFNGAVVAGNVTAALPTMLFPAAAAAFTAAAAAFTALAAIPALAAAATPLGAAAAACTAAAVPATSASQTLKASPI